MQARALGSRPAGVAAEPDGRVSAECLEMVHPQSQEANGSGLDRHAARHTWVDERRVSGI